MATVVEATHAPPVPAEAAAPSRPTVLWLAVRRNLGLVPALVLFVGFFALPMIVVVCYSFWRIADNNIVPDWTIDNYRYLFSVGTYVRTFVATLVMALVATVLTLLCAFPVAYWLARYVGPRWRPILLVGIILPFWTSYLLRVIAWTSILGEKGVINRSLMAMGWIDHPLSFLLYNRAAVVLVLVYLYFPFAALTLFVALERFDWIQLRAATDLGARQSRAFVHVLLPQIRPGIVNAIIFVFIPILGEYLAPQLVGGTRGVMIGNLIVNFFTGAQYTRGAAAALVIAAFIVVILFVFRRSLDVRNIHVR
ncbi:hypothetical protein B1R94_27020 [Mycolicibacterium litorale]|nr:hypothetical protein B1R94_27020 [Mycolicibacterium litorale]